MADITPQEALDRAAAWLNDENGTTVDDAGGVVIDGVRPLEIRLSADDARLVLTYVAQEAGAGASRADAVISAFPERGTSLHAEAAVNKAGLTITVTNHVYLDGLTRQSVVTALNELVAAVDGFSETPLAETRIHEVTMAPVDISTAEATEATETAEASATDEWAATHRVPSTGMQAWAEPDPAQQPITRLAGGVELALAEQRGDWAHVVGSNGWMGWVDARRLGAIGSDDTAATASPATVGGLAIRPLPLIGAIAVIVSAFIPWVSGLSDANSLEIALSFLWDTSASGQPYLGYLIIGLGVIALGLSVARKPMAPLILVIGLLAVAVTGAFLVQMVRGITDSGGSAGDIFDWIGIAPWVALVGGVLLTAGANTKFTVPSG
jgi:hypothetical protein